MAGTPDQKPATKPAAETELESLKRENADLREQLAAARANAKPVPNTRPKPTEPSYGMSEGTRQDIEQAKHRVATGEVTKLEVASPFTGKVVKTVTGGRE